VERIRDYSGQTIRLTDERLAHILEHPEMVGIEGAIGETLLFPHKVVQSLSDTDAKLYYRLYERTKAGEKYLCVVVKGKPPDPFVVTAYLTDRIKRGELLWPKTL